MWPSNFSWNWNSMDVGPKRDIVGKCFLITEKRIPDSSWQPLLSANQDSSHFFPAANFDDMSKNQKTA